MKKIEISSLGHTSEKEFPSTVIEFNTLAKNGLGEKPDAVLDLALDQYIAHGYLGLIRPAFVNGLPEEKNEAGEITAHAVKGVIDITGIARKSVQVKDKDGKPKVDAKGVPVMTSAGVETEGKYYERVLDTLSTDLNEDGTKNPMKRFNSYDAAHASFLPLFKTIVQRTPVDLSEAVREAKEKKLPAKFKTTAATLLAKGTFDKFVALATKVLKKDTTWTPAAIVPGVEIKMFAGTGSVPQKDKKTGVITYHDVPFNVNDADAESLGWLIKEHSDWKVAQEQQALLMD